ncbi:trem-like transcript 2 protein [Nannospalax galili]|uniref:Trem-like transcript 2 protein n=1 Tax=Nannospalax galili TaxID=1026970 RepID=A0A8C6R5C5_NANGA|nr:trem-like transcript 2 protein [Nannospalax galili]
MEPRPPAFLLLLLVVLLWLQSCVSGSPAENVYTKVRLREGETMSVQCNYTGRRNRAEGKAWCKVRKKKCDLGFLRSAMKGPRYSLHDDVKAKVVHITMEALTIQDSGRYWCMRNTSGILYPLVGFLLEVSPALTTERNTPPMQLPNTTSGIVTSGQVPISGPHVPFTSGMTVFTSGLLTLASGTTRSTSVTPYSSTGTGGTTTAEPRSTTGSQPVTMSPSSVGTFSADPVSPSTKSGPLSTSSPTTGICHQLTSIRSQESNLTAIVLVLTFLPVPMVLVVAYGVWKKKHMGSYSLGRDTARHCLYSPEGPEPPWKPAWSKITQ